MTEVVKIDLFNRAAVGGDDVNDVRLRNDATVHVSQHFLEVIHSGSDNRVRVSQQFAEVIHSGGDNRIRVSQHFLEIIHAFGSLPPGKSGGSPGHNKPPASVDKWLAFNKREQRHRNEHTGRFSNPDVTIYSKDYLPPNEIPIRQIDVVKTVRID